MRLGAGWVRAADRERGRPFSSGPGSGFVLRAFSSIPLICVNCSASKISLLACGSRESSIDFLGVSQPAQALLILAKIVKEWPRTT